MSLDEVGAGVGVVAIEPGISLAAGPGRSRPGASCMSIEKPDEQNTPMTPESGENGLRAVLLELSHMQNQLQHNICALAWSCKQIENAVCGTVSEPGICVPTQDHAGEASGLVLVTPRAGDPSPVNGPPAEKNSITELPEEKAEEKEFKNILRRHTRTFDETSVSSPIVDAAHLVFRPRSTWSAMPEIESNELHKQVSSLSVSRTCNFSSSEGSWDALGKQCCMRWLVLNPGSSYNVLWNLGGILLIALDVVMMPMQFFQPERDLFTDICQWMGLIFWTQDVAINFCVGYYSRGDLIMDPLLIAKHYMGSRFLLDLVIVGSDWLTFFMHRGKEGSDGLGRLGKSLRILRFTRMLKLLRLRKMSQFLVHIQDHIFSETASLQYGIFKITVFLLVLNHLTACCWYGIGAIDSAGEQSWVRQLGVESWPVWGRYFVALHWAIGQMGVGTIVAAPQNGGEYAFAVFIIMLALCTSTTLVSTVTNLMANLHQIRNYKSDQLRLVRRFCHEHSISKDLSLKILSFLNYAHARRRCTIEEADIPILNLLSKPLFNELQYERFAAVQDHDFFQSLITMGMEGRGLAAMHAIASNGIFPGTLAPNDVMFSRGDVAKAVYLIEEGLLKYDRFSGVQTVVPSQWVGEAVLWCVWVHMGRLQAKQECGLLTLDVAVVAQILSSRLDTWEVAKAYAADFVSMLNHRDINELSDILPWQHTKVTGTAARLPSYIEWLRSHLHRLLAQSS